MRTFDHLALGEAATEAAPAVPRSAGRHRFRSQGCRSGPTSRRMTAP